MPKIIYFVVITLSVLYNCTADQNNNLGNNTVNTEKKQAWNNIVHFEEKQYILESNRTASWFGALGVCIRNSSNLANIHSTKLMKAIDDNLVLLNTTQHFWIAANALEKPTEFVNALSEEQLNYSNWGEDQPDFHKANKRCVAIKPDKNSTGYVWYNFNCDDKLNFICETKKTVPTPVKAAEEETQKTKKKNWFTNVKNFFKG